MNENITDMKKLILPMVLTFLMAGLISCGDKGSWDDPWDGKILNYNGDDAEICKLQFSSTIPLNEIVWHVETMSVTIDLNKVV